MFDREGFHFTAWSYCFGHDLLILIVVISMVSIENRNTFFKSAESLLHAAAINGAILSQLHIGKSPKLPRENLHCTHGPVVRHR